MTQPLPQDQKTLDHPQSLFSSTPSSSTAKSVTQPLNGWLKLIGLGLVVLTIILMSLVVTTLWAWLTLYTQNAPIALFLVTILGNITLTTVSVFVLSLLQQRSIDFPKKCQYFLTTTVVFLFAIGLWSTKALDLTPDHISLSASIIKYIAIGSALAIMYLTRSKQITHIFGTTKNR